MCVRRWRHGCSVRSLPTTRELGQTQRSRAQSAVRVPHGHACIGTTPSRRHAHSPVPRWPTLGTPHCTRSRPRNTCARRGSRLASEMHALRVRPAADCEKGGHQVAAPHTTVLLPPPTEAARGPQTAPHSWAAAGNCDCFCAAPSLPHVSELFQRRPATQVPLLGRDARRFRTSVSLQGGSHASCRTMKLLTHNMLTSNVKGVKNGYPLIVHVC